MIVTEVYAVCEGCGYRKAAEEHPANWTCLSNGQDKRYFCSQTCVLHAVSEGAMPSQRPKLPYGITQGDLRMLELLGVGKCNKEISVALGQAESTVKNRLSNIYSKLGAQDRIQAVLGAHRAGLINLHQLAEQSVERLADVA